MPKDTYQGVRIGIKDSADVFFCRQNLWSDCIERRLVTLDVFHHRVSRVFFWNRRGWERFTQAFK